jgi:hypothetical protein
MNTSPPTKAGFETAFSGVGWGVYLEGEGK